MTVAMKTKSSFLLLGEWTGHTHRGRAEFPPQKQIVGFWTLPFTITISKSELAMPFLSHSRSLCEISTSLEIENLH